MIIVRVELLSAITGKTTELARMTISNDGNGGAERGDYDVRVLHGRSKEGLDKGIVQRRGRVENYPRLALHVWNLVKRALDACDYR